MQNEHWTRTIIASIGLAILLRIVLHIPILDTFYILGVIYVGAVLNGEAQFKAGFATIWGWIRFMGSVAAGIILFLALRVIATATLGISPSDSWIGLAVSGGAHDFFLNSDPNPQALWEMLFAFVAGGLVVTFMRGKARRLIGAIFVISFCIVSTEVAFPKWTATWRMRESLDEALARQGVASRLADAFAAARVQAAPAPSTPTFPVHETVQSPYPPCPNAPNYPFAAGEEDLRLEAHLPPDCLSGWITPPATWKQVLIDWDKGGLEYWFRDGYHDILPAGSYNKNWPGERHGSFRVRVFGFTDDDAVVVVHEGTPPDQPR